MPYRFAQERQDYSDFSSGRVFYGSPGHPAFPVRLASEIFQRCTAVRERMGMTEPCVLYDPCCGGAYHLATLAYLHWHGIAEIIGSDVDESALSQAVRNFSLLTPNGVDARTAEIRQMLAAYGKESHSAALRSAERLRSQLVELTKTHRVRTGTFRADAADGQELRGRLRGKLPDVVITDIPHGRASHWKTQGSGRDLAMSPVCRMLEGLLFVVSPGTVVAVASDKGQRISHEGFGQIERFRLGKRQVVLLRPLVTKRGDQ